MSSSSAPLEPGEQNPRIGLVAQSLFTSLRRRPVLVFAVCFLLGILAADWLRPSCPLPAVICLLTVAGAMVTAGRRPQIAAGSLMGAFLSLGIFLHSLRVAVPADDISHLAGSSRRSIEGVVVSDSQMRGARQVFRLRILHVGPAGQRATTRTSGVAVVRAPPERGIRPGALVSIQEASVKLPERSTTPGGFDYRGWLERQGVRAEITGGSLTVITAADTRGPDLGRLGLRLRGRLRDGIDRAMPGAAPRLYARLLMSMVYGLEAAPLPDSMVEDFRRAGTVHLLVVSGAQVTMLVFALLWLMRAGRRSIRWWHALCTGGALLVLLLIVGLGAPVARAVAMLVLLLMAWLGSWDYDLPTAIALAALVICLLDTNALFSLSFQLTFAATIGVSAFLPGRPTRGAPVPQIPPILRALRTVAWATLGAWLLATPLLAHHFRAFALLGNLANLVNVPLSGVTMVLGFLALPLALAVGVPWLGWLAPALSLLCWLSRLALDAVMHVNRLASSLPLAYLDDLHLTSAECLVWYAVVALLVMSGLTRAAQRWLDLRLSRIHPAWPHVSLLCLAALLVLLHGLNVGGEGRLEVTFLPVGSGQCAVVRCPSGGTLMIDCGGRGNLPGSGSEVAEGIIEPYLMQRGIRRLDFVLITHWDADHYNALGELLEAGEVGKVLVPPELPEARPSTKLRAALGSRSIEARSRGVLWLGGDVSAELVAPRQPLIRGSEDDANNNSVAVRLTYGQTAFLFTGDLEADGILRLVRDASLAGRPLASQVLQLPHHGRPVGRLDLLLDAVGPVWAVASTGSEARHYLRGEVTEALDRRGVRLLRTDTHGAVSFSSDGRALQVRTSERSTAMASAGAVAP